MSNANKIGMLEFITAWETSVQDATGVKGCAAKTGLTPETCQARASKYRNPEFKLVKKTDGGKTVYRLAVDGENGETETTNRKEAKLTTQGQPVVIKIPALDAAGNKIEIRKGLSLSTMPRGGGSRISTQVDAAEALLAKLRGETPAEGQVETESETESEVETATEAVA